MTPNQSKFIIEKYQQLRSKRGLDRETTIHIIMDAITAMRWEIKQIEVEEII